MTIFNSTVVQLEGRGDFINDDDETIFNSTVVQLEAVLLL